MPKQDFQARFDRIDKAIEGLVKVQQRQADNLAGLIAVQTEILAMQKQQAKAQKAADKRLQDLITALLRTHANGSA